MTNGNERSNPKPDTSKPVKELDEAALDRAAGGTKHPAKVTVPDLKLV